MTIQQVHFEFKLEVDINGLSTPNLKPLEVDTLLNTACEEVIKQRLQQLESTEKRFQDFSTLIKTFEADNPVDANGAPVNNGNPNLDIAYFKVKTFVNKPRTLLIELPTDFMFAVQEEADVLLKECNYEESTVEISPIAHDRYREKIKNPFEAPSEFKTYRLLSGVNDGKTTFEILEGYTLIIKKYRLRYIKYPNQVSLTNNVGFDLPEYMHREIIQHAAKNALRIIESPRYQANLQNLQTIE
jgi:hypothetical protein